MKLSELEYAAHWHSKLKHALADEENLLPFNVVGVVIDTRESGLRPHRIERGGSSGTGTISGICWSADLEKEMTAALHRVFQARVKEAQTNLDAMGIEIA